MRTGACAATAVVRVFPRPGEDRAHRAIVSEYARVPFGQSVAIPPYRDYDGMCAVACLPATSRGCFRTVGSRHRPRALGRARGSGARVEHASVGLPLLHPRPDQSARVMLLFDQMIWRKMVL